jgi:hypothetical protein
MTRDQARFWYANVLMDKIREDTHPSSTHMSMVEHALEGMPELVPEYMEILLEKVGSERFPSIEMLKRIQRVAELLPKTNQRQLEAGRA